jgi:NhaP-type Na+/H+ or K+/H+ antiporter
MTELTTVFGLLALIFLVAALSSGLVERAPVSFPMIFLGLGFILGGHGLGLIRIDLHNPALGIVATLSLAFVFFLDAINLRFDIIRKDWRVPVLSLGPGTVVTLVLIAIAAALLLRFSAVQALLIGAVLSSVDPVVLRGIVRDERIPRSIRESLKTEAGANDVIVLPVLLVLVPISLGEMRSAPDWLLFLGRLVLGPLAGAMAGVAATFLMRWVRSRNPISREYRALYGIGVLLAAYYVGARLGSSGFLAVFAAGMATALVDNDICDCFLEYGEITSEMMMLLAFLLFGVVLSGMIGTVALLPALIFTLVVLAIARPVAMSIVLRGAHVSAEARRFIGWFGPRGLTSLLFGLLLVSTAVPGAEQVLAVTGVVVIVSVILHGVSAGPLAARYSQAVAKETLPEERVSTTAGLYAPNPAEVPRITPQALAGQMKTANPPVVLDVRSRSSYEEDDAQIPGSIRVVPDEILAWAKDEMKDREIVTYCT